MSPDPINDGGAAFPYNEKNNDGSHYYSNGGMSLRDYFAAQAMMGMNASPSLLEVVTSGSILDGSASEKIARQAYKQADAMIATRGDGS